MITRVQALELVKEQNPEPWLVQHALASEAVMRGLARHFGEDEALWGLTGLLHDVDFPHTKETPERHGILAMEMLAGKLPEEGLCAVRAHNAECTGTPAQSRLGKALRPAESVTGLIITAALVRPTGMEGMEAKSLKKKMKDKAFAAGVSRERIRECEALGLTLDDFLKLSIDAMTGAALTGEPR